MQQLVAVALALAVVSVLAAGCGGATAQRPATPAPGPPPVARSVPSPAGPLSASMLTALDGWVLSTVTCGSGLCPQVVRTRDGGVTWQPTGAPPAPASVLRFRTVAVGYVAVPGLAVTRDGGTTWAALPVPGGGTAAALAIGPAGVYLATRPADGAGPRLYLAAADGQAWQPVPGGSPPGDAGGGVSLSVATYTPADPGLDSVDVLGTAPGAGLARDVGGSWRTERTPCPAPAPLPVAVDTNGNGVTVLCGGGRGGASLRQDPDAMSPSLREDLPHGAADGRVAGFLVAADSSPARIYHETGAADDRRPVRTVAGGGRWSDLAVGLSGSRAVAVLTPTSPGGRGGVWLSRDGGADWYPADLARRTAPPGCAGRDLTLRAAGGDAALGNTELTVAVHNRGRATCTLAGYPTVRGTGSATADRVRPAPAPAGYIPSHRDTGPAVLPPGGDASFFLSSSDAPPGCVGAPALSVTFTDGASVLGRIPFQSCRGAGVSPVVPGIEPANAG